MKVCTSFVDQWEVYSEEGFRVCGGCSASLERLRNVELGIKSRDCEKAKCQVHS